MPQAIVKVCLSAKVIDRYGQRVVALVECRGRDVVTMQGAVMVSVNHQLAVEPHLQGVVML